MDTPSIIDELQLNELHMKLNLRYFVVEIRHTSLKTKYFNKTFTLL